MLGASLFVVLLLIAAGAIVAVEGWHGPTVLSVSAGHGIDTGDLLAFPLVVLAIALCRRRTMGREQAPRPASRAAPAAAVVLGTLLLLAGVVPHGGGGPLVPSGGGTFDGTVNQASGSSAVPVGRWSDLAVTYDGATLRLYVNGTEVSSRRTTGKIQITPDPLWIGGNQAYGEHFRGLIDEVRVYSRALDAREIRRRQMDRPIEPARRPGRRLRLRRGFGHPCCGLVRRAEYGRDQRRHVGTGPIRRRAELRRLRRRGEHPSVGVAEPHERDDALRVDLPERGPERLADDRPASDRRLPPHR